MNDLDISRKVKLQHISKIAEKFGVNADDIDMYGKHKAKLPLSAIDEKQAANSNLILVSAISPTPAGEGKTTVSIGLSEGLNKVGKKTTVVLREPSLGPVFGSRAERPAGDTPRYSPWKISTCISPETLRLLRRPITCWLR
jgi:formate--tetrahydrofolate ligase